MPSARSRLEVAFSGVTPLSVKELIAEIGDGLKRAAGFFLLRSAWSAEGKAQAEAADAQAIINQKAFLLPGIGGVVGGAIGVAAGGPIDNMLISKPDVSELIGFARKNRLPDIHAHAPSLGLAV